MNELPPSDDSTRDLLLRSARHLFAEHGYDGVSIRDIVAAAQVNVSLVSYYFGGKEGLYRECIKEAGKLRLATVQGVLTPAATAAEFVEHLQTYVARALEIIAADLESPKLIAAELSRGSAVFEDLLRDVFIKVHLVVAGFFEDAQHRGFVRPELNSRLLASMLQGLLNNEARLDAVKGRLYDLSLRDPVHRNDCARHIIGLMLGGILVERRVEARP